jgi:proteasome accessory factor B
VPGRVPGEQRVFSLVLALVVSPEGLTKQELLSTVHGYAGRARSASERAALDRQFERDKEQLRELGIQIDTLDSPLQPGNNQLTRYRISKEQLEFPSELRFDERELMLLRLAALAWSEGSLSAESRRATMKLEALGAGLDVQHLGVAPSLGTAEPAAAPLQRAIDEGRIARFDYTLPGRAAPLERRVAPLRLHRVDGRWHLISWDLDRAADRVFLLSRISGEVRVAAERFDPALRERGEPAIAALLALREQRRAEVLVRCGSVAEARLAPRALGAMNTPASAEDAPPREPGSGDGAVRGVRAAEACGGRSEDRVRLTIGVLDPHLFAEEIIGYGADAVVTSPESLRGLVADGLRRIAAAHGAPPIGAAPASPSASAVPVAADDEGGPDA